ncbi:predicted protein [Sparassis crispa]|uniref:Fungal-type protein kinase domain-containing protein n=1 Tax=Sparassis crispa TaxID=139825 RepID=A0A401GRD0_9APHY|nr:predicted protein [Sparassis crispa]GBE84788.1 predicted protein [Sparassis crispa]
MGEFIPGRKWTLPMEETGKWQSKFKDVALITKESQMYPGFCEAVNLVLNMDKDNRLVARDMADRADATEDGAKLMGLSPIVRPDVSIYAKTPEAVRDYELTAAEVKRSACAEARHEHLARVCRQHLCVPVEIKIDHTSLAFEFLNPEKKPPVRGESAKGQITDYASKILLAQHREFCLLVYIFRSFARLVRWDRFGAVVSERFNYIRGRTLQTFIHRVGHMSDSQLGCDPTVVPATPAEVTLMASCKDRLNDYHKLCLDEAMSDGWPIHKVAFYAKDVVDSEALRKAARSASGSAPICNSPPHSPSPSDSVSFDDNATLPSETCSTCVHSDDALISEPVRYFLIGRPRFAAHSPTGRATWGYVAYDMEAGGLAFLKDTWRPDSSRTHTERQVYERLYRHDVQPFYMVVMSVQPENNASRRRTQDFGDSVLGRIHYRLVMKEVGRPLDDHYDSVEMVGVIFYALMAHHEAWEKAGVLHRDVSVGNDLADEDPDEPPYHDGGPKRVKGFRNDRDLRKYAHELDSGPTQKSRSGTWRFMSALLLQFPGRRYEVSDDLESFMHVVNWLALKWYRRHLRIANTLRQHVADTCDKWTRLDGYDVGGERKLLRIRIGKVPFRLTIKGGLSSLSERLVELCHERYKTVDMAALRAQPESPGQDLLRSKVILDSPTDDDDAPLDPEDDKHEAASSKAPSAALSTHK